MPDPVRVLGFQTSELPHMIAAESDRKQLSILHEKAVMSMRPKSLFIILALPRHDLVHREHHDERAAPFVPVSQLLQILGRNIFLNIGQLALV